MIFNSRVVPVFMLRLPKISGSSIVYYERFVCASAVYSPTGCPWFWTIQYTLLYTIQYALCMIQYTVFTIEYRLWSKKYAL